MTLTRITAPAAAMFTLEQLRKHLNLDACGSPAEHPDDALLLMLMDIATSELDGANGWLGRALLDQTWRLTLDHFPRSLDYRDYRYPLHRIYLPLTSPRLHDGSPAPAPVIGLTYTDPEGVEQTLTEGADFVVVTDNDPMYLAPVYGTCWPSTRCVGAAVRVDFSAGYGPDPEDVPAIIRNYMLVRIGQLYEFRELVIAGTIIAEVPYLRDSLENVRLRGYS